MFVLLIQSLVQINALGLIKTESINPKYFRKTLTVSKMKTRTATVSITKIGSKRSVPENLRIVIRIYFLNNTSSFAIFHQL